MAEILQPNQPQKFEGRNIRTPKRSSSINDIYLVQFEITREAWEALESIPKTAIIEGVMWFNDGDPVEEKPAKQKKEPKPKGAHGQFWRRMFLDGTNRNAQFFNHPDFHTAMNLEAPVTSDTAKKALHDEFGVESLTFVSPEQFVDFCVSNDLHSIATIASRLASETATLSVS